MASSIAKILARAGNDRRLQETARPLSAFELMRARRLEMDAMPDVSSPGEREATPDELTTQWLLDADAREREAEETHNARIRAKHGSLARPEPKSIYSPPPPSRLKFERPRKRVVGLRGEREGNTLDRAPNGRIPAQTHWVGQPDKE